MTSVPQQQNAIEDILKRCDERGIFCFNCDYNLTYCVSSRCPECGESFDREELLDWSGRKAVKFDGLLRRGESKPAMSLWRAALLHPARLGREIPVYVKGHQIQEIATKYRKIASVVLSVAYLIIALNTRSSEVLSLPIVLMVGWGCSRLCETLVSAKLERLVRWRFSPDQKSLVLPEKISLLFAAYLPVHASLLAIAAILPYPVANMKTIPAVSFGVFFWWWAALSVAVSTRAKSGLRCRAAMMWVMVAAVAVLVFGAIIGGLISVVLIRLVFALAM